MFDPVTAALIEAAPELANLDRARLPLELTRAYAEVVSLRELSRNIHSSELQDFGERLTRLLRLARTYESFVVAMPNAPSRSAAAFVAASVHQLVIRAQRAALVESGAKNRLHRDTISSDVSAMLLFLIAGYPADAAETANAIESHPRPGNIEDALISAVRRLAAGERVRGNSRELDRQLSFTENADEETVATQILWLRLYQGVEALNDQLLSGRRTRGISPFENFSYVAAASLQTLAPVPNDPTAASTVSIFAGPRHLAALLSAAGQRLERESVAGLEPPPGVPEAPWHNFTRRQAVDRPYLWSNHSEAIASGYLTPSKSAVISFPTGAGKSLLAELKVATAILRNHRVVYLAPTHALAWQIQLALRRAFPDRVIGGSLTGEGHYAERESKARVDVAVMTPERCLTLLGLYPADFSEVGLVVFDECHLLHAHDLQTSRRALDAMLCLLAMFDAAPDADYLLLSAMMSNPGELAAWLTDVTGRECIPLSVDWKPTRQARGCIVHDSNTIDELERRLADARMRRKTVAPPASVKKTLVSTPSAFFGLRSTWNTKARDDYALVSLLDEPVPLSTGDGWKLTGNKNAVAAAIASKFASYATKTLVFIQNKRHCETTARSISKTLAPSKPVLLTYENDLREAAVEDLGGAEHLINDGNGMAATHHGALLPAERRLAESLFERSDGIAALVATPTLAQGMNLPAEVVIIAGDRRFDDEVRRQTPLFAHELLNAAGRAGRAGHLASGTVLVVPDWVVSFDSEKSTIGKGWVHLQENIFSKADRCIEIDDPVEVLLDGIEAAATRDSNIVRYFLIRLPLTVGSTGSEASMQRVLGRSFAAFRARMKKRETVFGEKVESALRWRKENAVLPSDLAWLELTAINSGVGVAAILALETQLQNSPVPEISAADSVRWLFSWFQLRPELVTDFISLDKLRFACSAHEWKDFVGSESGRRRVLGVVLRRTLLWMKGATLRRLEIAFNTDTERLGPCRQAREFMREFVPELAYAVGIIARVSRARAANEGSSDSLPIAISMAAACVREGFDEPAMLAIRHRVGPLASRISCHKRFREIRADARLDISVSTFAELQAQVDEVMSDG